MKPQEKQVMKIASMQDFRAFRDKLNLTDRQKDIFELRYSRGLSMRQIAEEIKYNYDLVRVDMKDIREKLISVLSEEDCI